MYDSEARGARVLERLQLSPEQQRMMRVWPRSRRRMSRTLPIPRARPAALGVAHQHCKVTAKRGLLGSGLGFGVWVLEVCFQAAVGVHNHHLRAAPGGRVALGWVGP